MSMKTHPMPAVVALLGILLLTFGCEEKPGVKAKPPETPADAISVFNCGSDHDWIAVKNKQTVTWRVYDSTGGGASDTHTYKVDFKNKKTPFGSVTSFKFKGGTPSTETVERDAECAGDPTNVAKCKYPYDLVKKGLIFDTVCPDPGIHIIPD